MKNYVNRIHDTLTIEPPSSTSGSSPKSSATEQTTEDSPQRWLSILEELCTTLKELSDSGLARTLELKGGMRGSRVRLFDTEVSRIDSATGGLYSIELTVYYRKP